ncbi:hypothetical protein MTR67_045502 [Solanum verrucosum]|uniref:Uncharacterized protein n=1 Tax=Solanum verrucosum TaxID=315347 RepID=A0AAF0UT45_SOLVR|nr:hypothetical protein MTR67_045502 [Solanum verrucosum]
MNFKVLAFLLIFMMIGLRLTFLLIFMMIGVFRKRLKQRLFSFVVVTKILVFVDLSVALSMTISATVFTVNVGIYSEPLQGRIAKTNETIN